MNYLGYDIVVSESNRFSVGGTNDAPAYVVQGGNKIVFLASCKLGHSFGLTPEVALEGVKAIIMKKLAGVA